MEEYVSLKQSSMRSGGNKPICYSVQLGFLTQDRGLKYFKFFFCGGTIFRAMCLGKGEFWQQVLKHF